MTRAGRKTKRKRQARAASGQSSLRVIDLIYRRVTGDATGRPRFERQTMTYAQAADVQAVLGRTLTAEETALVDRRLAQVERMILRRVPDLAEQIGAGDLDDADVIDIEAEAVLRLIRNPEGYASESDGTYSYQFNRETASDRLEILASEWETLGIKSSRMFSTVPNLVAPVRSSSPSIGG
jgi:uncharacterized protein YcaQ